MRRILPTVIDTKHDVILSQERRLAKTVAKGVVKMPMVTVWAFMIPFVFFLNLLQYKRTSETFVLNFLFTKKLALEAARDITLKGRSRQDVIARIDDRTSNILADDKQGVYSENVRHEQMDEINLLLDHYLKLLEAEGRNYESLIKNTYQTQGNYEAFLKKLRLAEKAVNRVAIQTVGETETTSELVSKMEKMTAAIRQEEAKKFFS